jgi:hypothetical protein
MKRNGKGEVSLTQPEFEVTAMRDYLFDQGVSVKEAAREALKNPGLKRPTKPFVAWLSQETLTVENGEVVDVPAETVAT